ncbi:hypothetical protein EVAR_98880_1 [Eumeta japonica]|uniref:Uncharacterized protein n=1 Tax=Eumeta variegata TaxID=151549 RepID=A0A4C2ABM9_EUMVA|nr:hypothetical protein EVAR_98880_1 [Eumeta japonica]
MEIRSASPPLSRVCLGALKPERSTVAVFFDVAKAFDRQTDISHLGMSALTDKTSYQSREFLAPPSLLCCTPRTNDVPRPSSSGVQLRYSRTIPRSLRSRNRST